MALRIEDYGLIGNTETGALVGRDGSIDWACLPRFDSGACFAALLGDSQHGRWLLGPAAPVLRTSRKYLENSLVLATEFETEGGMVRIIDCMPLGRKAPEIVRVVEGVRGEVPVRMELIIRFDYGSIIPWVRKLNRVLLAVGGPDALSLSSPVPTHGVGFTTVAAFTVREGQRLPFSLVWHPSDKATPPLGDPLQAVEETRIWWQRWCTQMSYEGPWRCTILRSLITLKALTFKPTGGTVAALTTSLPEKVGGVRNWDYRHCWLRDATFTLYALMTGGYTEEPAAWRDWLLRAVAGEPASLQIAYGLAGERRLPELVLDWLPGYEVSAPVRIGNAAVKQHQLDVYGEVMDALYTARRVGLKTERAVWALQQAVMEFLETAWSKPDNGIWEMRGPRRHFTHSKVMAWVAFDRAIKTVEQFGLEGPIDRWRKIRALIHEEVCQRGFDPTRATFTQFYGSQELDGSLLLLPLVGFLPATDPRMTGTVKAIERELLWGGLLRRYPSGNGMETVDSLPPGEGAFLPCSFWLADNYMLQGRHGDAQCLFERLLALQNDLGLLAEEYDPVAKRMVGNFPQAFSHVALINTALNLAPQIGPAEHRGKC